MYVLSLFAYIVVSKTSRVIRLVYKRQELVTIRDHLGPLPVFCGIAVAQLYFSGLCFLFCLLPSCVLCT